MFYRNAKVEAGQQLSIHRQVWAQKPALRYYYTEVFLKKIKASCKEGTVLEIGSGSGFLKDYWKDVTAIDIVYKPWLDAVCNCEKMPFRDSVFDNMVLIDVFHHLSSVAKFLNEAIRILKSGGKIIMIEPWITPLSYIFWRYVHHERCEKLAGPWLSPKSEQNTPFDGNAYIPYQCFCAKNSALFKSRFPQLKLEAIDLLGVFVYPLTGGFQPNLGIKKINIMKKLLKLEAAVENAFSPLSAARAIIKLENLK